MSFILLRCFFLVTVMFTFGASGCSMGESGIEPPFDKIFLPTGLAIDPTAEFLYVVNSNSDLRFNAGTVVAVNVDRAAAIRDEADSELSFNRCSKTRFERLESVSPDYCCWDLLDSNILNCNETDFVNSDSTIQIGSFGGAIALQPFEKNGETIRRLFVAVRSEPSVTYADVTIRGGYVAFKCTNDRSDNKSSGNEYCDEKWKIRRPSGALSGANALAEEPHFLSLDPSNQALYVGHLTVTVNSKIEGGGVSSIDICGPELDIPPSFAGRTRIVFPDQSSQSVANLTASSTPNVQVYSTAKYSSEVSPLIFRMDVLPCNPEEGPRDLSLVPSESFVSSAFLPSGADIRGVLFSDDQNFAYVLHRNASENSSNISALVKIDRSVLANGQRSNRTIDILKVCNGPTQMQYHDVGLGKNIYITCYDEGQIFVVDPREWRVVSIIEVGDGPNSLVFSPQKISRAYVASYASNHIAVIDLDPKSATRNRVIQRIGLAHGSNE